MRMPQHSDEAKAYFRSLPAALPDAEKTSWLARARDHVSQLPPKVRRVR